MQIKWRLVFKQQFDPTDLSCLEGRLFDPSVALGGGEITSLRALHQVVTAEGNLLVEDNYGEKLANWDDFSYALIVSQ